METTQLLAIGIPSVIALVASVIGYFLLRRSSKESNDTNAFSAVTDQLFALNKVLTEKLTALELKVTKLEADKVQHEQENTELRRKLETVEAELRDVRVVNGALGRYLGKLVRLWPVTVTLPQPDEPVTWA